MPATNFNIQGLSEQEVLQAREKYGANELSYKKENTLIENLKRFATEPMVILLLLAAAIYYISGSTSDGLFLSVAVVFQISISLFQYSRSKNALEKLKDLSQPNCKVIRNGEISAIKSGNLVVGDS